MCSFITQHTAKVVIFFIFPFWWACSRQDECLLELSTVNYIFNYYHKLFTMFKEFGSTSNQLQLLTTCSKAYKGLYIRPVHLQDCLGPSIQATAEFSHQLLETISEKLICLDVVFTRGLSWQQSTIITHLSVQWLVYSYPLSTFWILWINMCSSFFQILPMSDNFAQPLKMSVSCEIRFSVQSFKIKMHILSGVLLWTAHSAALW